MKNYFKIIPVFLASFLFITMNMKAGPLDGLWRNDRQNITLRIEEDQDGFRAKRMDQGIWYRYSIKDDHVYVDRNGNTYEILDQDEIQWQEAATRKRILFTRANERISPGDPRESDAWFKENDRVNQAGPGLAGRWYDRQTKERLLIEPTNNGYRVKTHRGSWERFEVTSNGRQIRSRSGDVIQLIDRNTIRWRSMDERHVHTMTRQGNGHAHRENTGFQKHDDRYDYKHQGKHHGKHNGNQSRSRGHKN